MIILHNYSENFGHHDNLKPFTVTVQDTESRSIAMISGKRNAETNYAHISQESIELLDALKIDESEVVTAIEDINDRL